MEYYYFVIIVVIVLKILFWTFYFYLRAQRLRQTQTPRFIIIGAQQGNRRTGHPYTDRSAIINHAEPLSATGPPPYAEVVKDSGPLPPSYDQAVGMPGAGAMPVNSATGAVSNAGAMPVNSATGGASGTSSVPPNPVVQATAPPGAASYSSGLAAVQASAPPEASSYTSAVAPNPAVQSTVPPVFGDYTSA